MAEYPADCGIHRKTVQKRATSSTASHWPNSCYFLFRLEEVNHENKFKLIQQKLSEIYNHSTQKAKNVVKSQRNSLDSKPQLSVWCSGLSLLSWVCLGSVSGLHPVQIYTELTVQYANCVLPLSGQKSFGRVTPDCTDKRAGRFPAVPAGTAPSPMK